MAASRTAIWRPKTSPRPPACASSFDRRVTGRGVDFDALILRRLKLFFGALPVVDAAPPRAIVGIAGQAVGPMDVVRLVLIGVRAAESARQLGRGAAPCRT